MGVYINMKMPTSCDDCRLNNGISCYAVPEYTEDGVVGRTDDRPDWCPLVHVPPHGKLIDANALDCIGYCCIPKSRNDTFDDGVMWLVEQIDSLPTIIPAEEGEA